MQRRGLGALGAILLFGGLAATLVVLPRLTYVWLLVCSPTAGGTQCFGGFNPAYVGAFVTAVAGAVALSYAALGRRFVASPLFIGGIALLGWGAWGLIFAYLNSNPCGPSAITLCISGLRPDSFPFATAVLGGAALVAWDGMWLWASQRRGRLVALPSPV